MRHPEAAVANANAFGVVGEFDVTQLASSLDCFAQFVPKTGFHPGSGAGPALSECAAAQVHLAMGGRLISTALAS